MFEWIRNLFREDNREILQGAKKTYDLYLDGIITKENAICNLWQAYDRVGDDSKDRIALKIKHIDRGF